jgi:hypothetical protein
MTLKNISKKDKLLYLILILSVLILLKIIIGPIIANWSEVNLEISRYEFKLDRAFNLIAHKESINSLYKDIARLVSDEIVVSGDEESVKISVYKFIDGIAALSKVRLKSLEPLVSDFSADNKELYFRIKIESSQRELVDFLYYLESPYNLNSIEEVKVVPYRSNLLLVEIKLKRILL